MKKVKKKRKAAARMNGKSNKGYIYIHILKLWSFPVFKTKEKAAIQIHYFGVLYCVTIIT